MDRHATREKVEMEPAALPYLSSTVSISQLRNVVRQAGNTAEDRYKILEARDRLMRLKQARIHTLDTAKVTIGTCPDMCPEKERLMREFQRQVAPYELIESVEYKINHAIAVKQYSRSSADQEEPMPQDLRPVSTLKMTMSYLLHEIADLCDEDGTNLAEWYHFLWDRTRGIRKDITQQELCCIDTVELVEQCARFHIVCSERLCAEELSVFDKKINTENLTKCLQTLKYMYHDLGVKGIVCKNEAEFRAYIILLNLNNATFLWDLKALPAAIQKSREVNFALRVYSSIQSNNYAKFFRLVRETTYLNACLLLRYFCQVRVQALSIMVKAYCRTTSTAYPLYEFMDILGFEDESEAINFCEQSGLNVSNDEMHIILNRQNITLPPTILNEGRAKNLVESKRIAMGYSFGQAIAGGVMPDQLYINHRPHNSFDSAGYLTAMAVNAEDQNSGGIEVDEKDEENEEGEVNDDDEEEEEEDVEDPYEFMDEDVSEQVESSPSSEAEPEIDSEHSQDGPDNVTIFRKSKIIAATSTIADTHKKSFNSIFTRITPKTEESSKKIDFGANIISKPGSSKNTNIFGKKDGALKFTSNDGTLPVKTKSIFSEAPKAEVFASPVPIFPSLSAKPSISDSSNVKLSSNNQKMQSEISKSPKSNFSFNIPIVGKQTTEIIKKPVDDELYKLQMKVLQQKKIEQSINESTEEIAEKIQSQVINEMCSIILTEEIEKFQIYDQFGKTILDEILTQFIAEDCKHLLDEELYLKKKLHDITKQIENRIVTKYYKIWRQRVLKKKQQRKSLASTPVWLPKRSLADYAKSLWNKEQNYVINNMRMKRFKYDYSDEQRDYLDPVELEIFNGLKENAKILDVELLPLMFWKLVMSWPNLNEKILLRRYKNIMSEYLCPRHSEMDPIIKSYKPNHYQTLNICIKNTEDIINKEDLIGIDGLLFITTDDEEDLKTLAERLKKTVISRQKLMPVPLYFVIFGDNSNAKNIVPTAELKNLLDTGYLSEYTVHHEKHINESIVLKLTQTAILWLTRNKSPPIPLEMNSLTEIIGNCLTDELWLRITDHARFNINLFNALEDPKFVINIHNEAVGHLMDLILDPESLMYTDLSPEFKEFLPKNPQLPCGYEFFNDNWKNQEYREKLESIINSFILPPWPFQWPITDAMELDKCIIRYSQETLKSSTYPFIACTLLNNRFLSSDNEEFPNFVYFILEIIKENLRHISPATHVIYNKNHMKHFCTLPWWLNSSTVANYSCATQNTLRAHDENQQIYKEPIEKKRRIEEDIQGNPLAIDEEYKNISIQETDPLQSFIQPENIEEVHDITEKFETSILEQLMSSQKLEEKIREALLEADM